MKKQHFVLDLASPKLLYRYKQASLKRELIAKAIGIKAKDNPLIVDATAGFGRDSLILAALGYEVILLEQSSIVHLILQDALQRARTTILQPAIARMKLFHTDANVWLRESNLKPDVIYLDPMFPARQKSAAVKKEAVVLQALLGDQTFNDLALLQLSLCCAKRRVVVKRPRLSGPLGERAVDFSFNGRSIRYDIYLPKTLDFYGNTTATI